LFQISRQAPYRKDLIAAAEPLMTELAKTANETVLLVTLREGCRFILTHISGQQHIQVGPQVFFETTVYETATGRLLLAYLADHELEKVVAEHGLPGKRWSKAVTTSALKQELAKIRKQGWTSLPPNGEVVGLAFPVSNRQDQVIATLGLFLPRFRFKDAHKTTIMKGMSTTAAAINKCLHGNK